MDGMHSLFDAEGALMGKPLFETHRFGDRRTVVRRFKKGEQVHFLAHHGTEADRATVFREAKRAWYRWLLGE